MSTSTVSLLASLAVAFFVLVVVDAKCQIVCHQWTDSTFTRCDNAEVKCANDLPEGYFCTEFSTTRPVRCLEKVPEKMAMADSNPRPRRYKPAPPTYIDYAVDKAPNVEYLQSKEFV